MARLAGLFLASLVTPFGAARLLRKLRVVSGESVRPRLERRPHGRLFEFRNTPTLGLIKRYLNIFKFVLADGFEPPTC